MTFFHPAVRYISPAGLFMDNIQLVIFDWDGTLADSEYLNNFATSLILKEAGYPQYTVDYSLEKFMGKSQVEIFAQIEADNGCALPADIMERYIETVSSYSPQYMRPTPGAIDVVKMLAARFPVCVASNGEKRNVLNALKDTGLAPYFGENVYTAALVPRPKPAPDLFLYAADRHGVKPAHCVVVEDSLAGAAGGVAAGMTVIGYTGVHHRPEEQKRLLEAAGVKTVINDLARLPDIIGQLAQALPSCS